MAQNLEYNVYIDPSYTEAITGTTHAITGEVLTWQENAFNAWNNNRYIADDSGAIVGAAEGYTAYYTNVNRAGNSLYNDGRENVYISGSAFNYVYAYPKGGSNAAFLREAPLKVYIENSRINNSGDSGLFMLGQNVAHAGFTSDLEITIKNTIMSALVLGGGNQGDNYDNRGTLIGDITFNISGSTISNNDNGNILFHKGNYCTADEPGKVKGTITDTFVANNIFGFKTGGSNVQYADIDLTVTGSSVRNNIQFGSFNPPAAKSPNGTFIGTGVMKIAGSTAANVYSNSRYSEAGSAGQRALENATFSLVFNAHANDTIISGNIGAFDTITVNAGANVRANSILAGDRETVTLNVAVGSSLNVATLTGITTINVTGELVEPDTVIISGLGEGGIGDALVYVGETQYEQGIFPGFYEVSGGNLIIHNATSTVLLVNSNYTNGAATELGPKGYTTFANAQTAVTDKATTTIMLYGADGSVEANVFTADVVTKDYTTNFAGSNGYEVSLDSFSIVVGDTAADVESANVTASYTNYINSVKFGNVTGTATVNIDHAGADEDTRMGALDLTGAVIANAQISVSDSFIGDVKLADQEGSAGKLTISNSTIENVYGGAGNVEADMTGANTIKNVFAEGQGSKIKLAGSNVETYTAGYSQSGTVVENLTYNDSIIAQNIIVGGNENTITGNVEATIGGGAAELLKIGGTGDTIGGDVDLTLAGGKFSTVSIAEDATVAGSIDVNLAGGTVTALNSTFYGLVYGASVTGALDGGSQGTKRTLNVLGHAKVESVANFDELNVTGGTLNVAGGDRKSEISEGNTLAINGDILNERTINAGVISAVNLNNYGAIGTIRKLDQPETVGLNLSGDLNNYGVLLTASANIGGNLVNTRKITALGDITVNGTFNNSGDIYLYATSSREGVFTQKGGIVLSGVDMVNTGFISAGKLSGVNNLTTSKMYVTGGAEITGNITIDAGAEVCFTNKANPEVANGLTLGGSITMGDTSNLVVSGDLTTTGTKTITVNCGDLVGANEIVRAEGGVNAWTIKLAGVNAGNYEYVQTETSVVIYSTDELFVNSGFSADADCYVDGHKLAFGKNAFASVADAVAAAKAGAKIVITNDATGMEVNAAGFDVVIDGSVVKDVTAKSVTVTSDSTVNSIVSASGLTIDAGALLTVLDTIPADLAIAIDASEGTGSRLVLDVDPEKVTLDASKVTIIGKETYKALVLAGEGETAPTHAGDLFITSPDNAYYIPALFDAIIEKQTVPDLDNEGKEQYDAETGELITKEIDVIVGYTAKFVDGDTFDPATGDAMFADLNAFGGRQLAVDSAKANNGIFVLVDNVINNAVGEDGVTSMIEVDRAKGDSGAGRAIVGVNDDGSVQYVSDQDHTTIIYGSTSTGNVYGLSRWYNMSGDYTLIVKNSASSGDSLFVTGNNMGSVMSGNIYAEITGSTYNNLNLAYGTVGTEDFKPVDVTLVMRDSRVSEFRGLRARDSSGTTKFNANVNLYVYDSMVNGAFYGGVYTADWVANNANVYQANFVSGSINVEVGGTTVSNQFRPGDSLPHGANALQTFNVPTTLHVVATEKSPITRADWVMEWDTIIIDADATLQVNNGLEFTTAYKAPNSPQDNGGQLIQIYVNMSGYAGGTRTVINAGFINTDATMSNISVIGDNDMTGQRQLVYGQNTAFDSYYHLNRVAIFDKADDMYVNTSYNDGTSGTAVGGQELYYNANAHSSFEGALVYATEWGGSIIVTGGTFEAQDFNGNNVEIQNGFVDGITMGTRKESTLKIGANGSFTSADGSGKSAMEITGNAKVGDVSNFTAIGLDKKAGNAEFGAVSGSNLAFFADAEIKADSLNLSDATIVIDVTGFVGSPHAVISTENGITGFVENKTVTFTGENADKFGAKVSGKDLILTTTIQSDTYANSTYTAATTGTILPDGTYLEYGFNAFSTLAEARAALGSAKNTLTVTGGSFTGDLQLAGANFAMTEGVLGGVIYGTEDDDLSGMNITIGGGTVGGIDLTAGDGAYSVSKAAISLADGVSVTGNLIGGGDTTLTVDGNVKLGGIEGVSKLTLTTNSLLEAGYIELAGGTIFVTGGAVESTEGNLRKIISTQAGINGVTYAADEGLSIYTQGKDVYLMDLSHIYFDPTFTEAITGTTMANGDVLQWNVNAFSSLDTAYDKTKLGGTLYVSSYTGNLDNPSNTKAISYNVTGGSIANFHVLNRDNRSTAKIYDPITITIDGSRFTNTGDNDGNNDILGRSNSYTGVDQSVTYYAPITINMSNGRNDGNLRFVGQWDTIQSGITLNLTNWDLRGDLKPFFGDARAAENDSYHSFIDVTFDNVTFGGGAKWIGLAQVTDWGKLDYINLTIKNSTILGGATGADANNRIAAFGDGNNDRHNNDTLSNGPINFTIENSQINSLLSASGLTNNTVASKHFATLFVKGTDNYVRWANWFDAVDMTTDDYLSGGTITLRDGGAINVDATGYEGPTALLISLTSGFTNDAEALVLNLKQDGEKYQLVAGKKGVVIWDGAITDIYTNPTYTGDTTGSKVGDGILLYGKNAFEDLETAKAAVTAGNKLYVTGGEYADGLYGTLAEEASTPFVDLVVTDGDFSGEYSVLAAAAEEKTVTGNARIEVAGGTFGKAPVVEEGEVVDPAVLVSIDGSKDSVGGTSELVISSTRKIYANVTNFDKLTVTSKAQVGGDITVSALDIDCNGSLTVDGVLDVGAIHLVSEGYTGPSKIVLTSDSLKDIADLANIITVDAPDRFYIDGEKKNVWLVSDDPGNIFVDANFTAAIDGTRVGDDLLIYGVNAFSDMNQAIARLTSDYTMYVYGGNFNEVYDLTGIGQVSLQLEGGSFGGFKIGDGADSDHRSTVRITATTSAVSIGSLTGVEGSTIGYRVIANKDATINTIDGVQYFRMGTENIKVDGITYREKGGEFVINLEGYTGGAAAILQTVDGVNNFIQPVEGQTFSRTQIGLQNNADLLMPYYDPEKKAVYLVERGEFAFLSADASADTNGKVVSIDGKTATMVYGYNTSEWNVNVGRYAVTGGTIFADGGENGAFYYFFTAAPVNVNVTGITTSGFVAGYNDDNPGQVREGDFTLYAEGSTFTWFTCFAGQGGSADNQHQILIVGSTNAETGEFVDGTYNLTFKGGAHDTNDFRVARYANISGGTANITFEDYDLRGDLKLFNYVYANNGEWLKEANLTLKNVQAPAAKWCYIWDNQGNSSTKLSITVIDSNFVGDDHVLGLLGEHVNGDWDGEAHVYISGFTMGGRLSGARGTNADGNANNVLGTRTLHVIGTDNRIRVTREFTTIDIEDGAVLKGDTILMPGTASEAGIAKFILRGEAGYEGPVKEYAVMGNTINGIAHDAAEFLDAEGNEIGNGYKAIIGHTNAFIYKTDKDVYYSNTYSDAITGATITEGDGSLNYLVYGDNAVNAMKNAYASVDLRGGSENAAIKVVDAMSTNLYTYGYRTIVNGGQITNVVGGTNATVTKVDSGEVDPETGEPIMIDEIVPAPGVASVDITVNKGATIGNVIVSGETYSAVAGDALITVSDGASISGTFNGGADYVGGVSSLVFQGDASAKAITSFDSVTLNANNVVTLSGEFSGASITIDVSSFADFTKKVLVAEGGFGDTSLITVNVASGFGYQFLDDAKTLVVTSSLVGNTYADADWTEADVHNKFIGDMALVWEGNAFSSFAAAAAAIGEGSTLYLEGGTSSEAVTLTKKNDVIVSANTTGTALASLTGDGGTLTVSTDFTATEISGFSGIKLNAVDDLSIGAITLTEGGTLTIDMTGYKQDVTDAAVITVEGGINNLTDENIVLVGEGSGVFHAYYSHLDNSVHAMRIDNFYVDTAFGTAGENIVEGQTNGITGETLLWGVNAFYYLNDALAKMAPGQGLYINGRDGNNVDTRDQVANVYLTNSNVPVIITGYTAGDKTYVGDVSMTIKDSVIGTAAGSYLFGTVTASEPWSHNEHIIGNLTLDVSGSTIGGDANQTVQGFHYVNVLGTEEAPSLITYSFTDTVIRDDLNFIGDSPIGKTEVVEIDGQTQTYIGANVVINMTNVDTPADKWWVFQDGDQESKGTVTFNIKDSTFGDGRNTMRLALDNNWGMGWDTHAPRSASDFIFNLENVEFKGYLMAGRLDMNSARDAELTSYTGKKVLNLVGDNTVNYAYWFRELNMDATASLTGNVLRMATTGAKINIDVTGYTGASKALINMASAIENVTLDDIVVTGLDPEDPAYTLVTDYDPEAETPAITAVVLKGAIKDIYVNGEYTEELKLGTSYNGEALFFGENAFKDIATAAPALTEGATLYITGGKSATDLALTNAITIDASAQLTYRGSTALTIAGDVVNAGTVLISAKGFIVTGLESDVLVLTANAITGDGEFRTDNSAYTINVIGNEVHLLAKKTDVYVNTAWSDKAEGDIVEVEGGTAVIGTDAFATADAAAAVVSVKGSITVINSKVSFTNAITCTVTATEGSVIENASVGASAAGTLILKSGAVATEASVRGTGTLTVEAGAKVAGGLGMLEGAAVSFAEGSFLDIDISALTEGASAPVTNYSILTGTPTITVTIAADQKDGTYALASGAAGFNSAVALQTTAAKIADLTLGTTVQVDGIDYTLALTDNNDLTLTKKVYVAPITVTYVNEAWSTLAEGDVVTVSGGTAIVGYDAFATGDAAIAAVVNYGEVKAVAGNVSFTNAIDKTVTVLADATLVGKATFATAVTINGTVAFDTAYATAEAAQFGGFSFVSGTATYTLTAAAVAGTYLLATDAAGFTGSVTFGDATLTVGGEAAIVGDFTYGLSLTDGTLALTIAEYVPPTPETPTQAYVNSEWSKLEAGATVTVGTKTATIGYDAFAALDAAIAGVTDDGKINVVGGEITFGAYSKTITVDAGATIVGKNTFDKAITVNGEFAFDTAFATAEAAQITGFSFVSGAATYTLSVATPAVGTYLLASDAAAFNSDVVFGSYTLKVGAEALAIGDFTYALGITDNNELALLIAEKPVPPTPTELTQAYANSEWAGLADGTVVGGATIGYDGFATLGAAEAAVTADGKVNVTGGEITFGAYSKAITVDAGATVVGKNVFDKAITINGTVAFDTAVATAEAAQISGLSFVSGTATYTLTDAAPAAGTYLLATDAASFNSSVAFGTTTLTVGAEATLVGSFTYALSLTDGTLALTVAEYVPPTPTYDLVYANSAWTGLADGTSVTVGDKTATIGQDAFASADMAILNVTDTGLVEIVGGEATFTNATTKAVTVDAGATLVGKNTFGAAITINGTVAFDTAFATAEAAQFGGFSYVSGTATYTLTAAAAVGTYLLASEVTAFTSDVTFGDVTLTVGAEATVIGDFTYALSLADGKLALTIAEKPVPPTPTELTQAYANSEWAGQTAGTVIGGATIGYDGFATLAEAEAAVTADGKVNVTGGEITFGAYSKTITVDADAKVVSKNVFDKAITINGTVVFDLAIATATEAQVTGLSYVSGDTKYTLIGTAAKGTYLLATDAAGFTGAVTFGEYTLTVGAEPITIGELNYTLEVTGAGELALSVSELVNGPDDGWNNYVYDKKLGFNPNLDKFVVNTLVKGVEEVFVDEKYSVSMDGKHNFVNGAKATVADTADYAKIVLDSGASLSFKVDATAATKFSIYQLVESKGKFSLKKKQSTALKKDKATGLFAITTKNVLLEAGTYFIAADCTDKKAFEDLYNVYVNDAASTYFDNGDTGWNNYVYDKKATPAKNPDIDKFVENKLVKNGTNDIIIEGTGSAYLQLDDPIVDVEGWSNFVGFGDAADYAVLNLEHATSLSLSANALDASKLVIYSFDGVSKMKALQTTKLKKAKGATEFSANTKNLLLEAGTYFVSMQSTNAKKGGNAYYNVKLNDATTVYDDGDTGWNNYVYDKKATPQVNPNIGEFVVNEITSATEEVFLDNAATAVEGWSNFVGFGDAADYAKIFVAGNSAKLSFTVTSTDAAKFIIYSFDGVSKMKALQTSTLKKAKGATLYTVDTKALALAEGEYFISVQSTNAKKGGAAYYNVAVNQTLSSGLLDVSAAVSMPNDLQFAGQDVDTFADVAAFNADSQLIDDKQSWQSIAALA